MVMLLAGCAVTPAEPGNTRVTLEGIRPGAQDEQVTLLLNLQNASDQVMQVAGLDYRLELNGAEFAWGASRQAVDVPGRGEALFSVTVPGQLPANERGDEGGYRLVYNLSGTVYLADGRGRLPFVQEGLLTWQEPSTP